MAVSGCTKWLTSGERGGKGWEGGIRGIRERDRRREYERGRGGEDRRRKE